MPFIQNPSVPARVAAPGAIFVKGQLTKADLPTLNGLTGKANSEAILIHGTRYDAGRIVYLNFYGTGKQTEDGLVFVGDLELRPILPPAEPSPQGQTGDFFVVVQAIQQGAL